MLCVNASKQFYLCEESNVDVSYTSVEIFSPRSTRDVARRPVRNKIYIYIVYRVHVKNIYNCGSISEIKLTESIPVSILALIALIVLVLCALRDISFEINLDEYSEHPCEFFDVNSILDSF